MAGGVLDVRAGRGSRQRSRSCHGPAGQLAPEPPRFFAIAPCGNRGPPMMRDDVDWYQAEAARRRHLASQMKDAAERTELWRLADAFEALAMRAARLKSKAKP